MEQNLENYGSLCCACLSYNRTVVSVNKILQIYDVFKFIMSDYSGDKYNAKLESEQFVCWECHAIMMKFKKFKKQVHNAQQNLRLAISQAQTKSKSLSSLTFVTKTDFDGIFVNYSDDVEEDILKNKIKKLPMDTERQTENFKKYDVAQALRDNIILGIQKKEAISEADYIEDPLFTEKYTRQPLPELTIDPTSNQSLIISAKTIKQGSKVKPGYTTVFVSEADIIEAREESKQNEVYKKSNFKCELCIIGFDTHERLVDHYNDMHKEKPNHITCKICYTYIQEDKLKEHTNKHHWRYICKTCNRSEGSVKLITLHIRTHVNKSIKERKRKEGVKKEGRKKLKDIKENSLRKTDLRNLGSKTTIVGYACPECDMVFKNTTARMMHVARFHTEGFICDHCKKKFANRNSLITHLKLHQGPLPQAECPICHKMVRKLQLRYHIRRHQNTTRYECKECNKVYQDLVSYQGHLKYSRLHGTDEERKRKEGVKKEGRKKLKDTRIKENSLRKTDLRNLGSKTTIVGYACPECDMVFKNTTARMMHVARFHTEGFICDHCKKKFANRNSLITHLKLHQGPLPQAECPICHKMVRKLQLRYHIRRHQNTTRYECKECNKVYQDLVSYQGHLKYSRLHGTDEVFKFPCPMCNKGYPTKQAMQDHFNYQHLGKTTHKCPICNKPLASQRMVEQHVKRAHTEKQPKPRNHVCQQCGKAFYEKKCLIQHEAIHTGERPLSCDICHMTFRQKASLYTHKKRVHKIFPARKHLEFMEKN